MAKPPDGFSAWHHHSDGVVLCDPDGREWMTVSVPVAGSTLDILAPYAGQAGSSFYVLQLRGDPRAGVLCACAYAALSGSCKAVQWTTDTPPELLLPASRQVGARTTPVDSSPDRSVIAEVHAERGGRLWITDPRGRTRLELRLHRDGPPPAHMKLVTRLTHERRPLVDVFALDDKDLPVRTIQTSLP